MNYSVISRDDSLAADRNRCRDTQPDTMGVRWGVRDSIEHTALTQMLSSDLSPQSSGNPVEEESRGVWEAEGWRIPGGLGPLWTNWTHRDWSNTQRMTWVCPRPSAYRLVFWWNSRVCEWAAFWCLLLGTLFFCWVDWSGPGVTEFVFSWYILLCMVIIS